MSSVSIDWYVMAMARLDLFAPIQVQVLAEMYPMDLMMEASGVRCVARIPPLRCPASPEHSESVFPVHLRSTPTQAS